MDFSGAKAVVIGLAKSGLASIELLASKGAVVTACDARPLDQLPGAAETLSRLGVPFQLQSWESMEHADWVVISPGVPEDLDVLERARRKGIRVIGEVELASYYLEGDTIGITGSNGKTTTTAMVGHVLGECGIPAQVGGTSERFPPLPWPLLRGRASGTCWSCRVFNWRPSGASGPASGQFST